jgi:hypothetical protein
MSDRYKGKPLVRLLECYVLHAIGKLSSTDLTLLYEMTPKLRDVYQAQGDWYDIIESIMELPADMPERIVELWERNQELAKANGETLHPQDYAEMFVDQNLAG